MDFSTALAYTRHNSGRHFIDSGDAYGRHWQKPAPAEDAPLIRITEDGAQLETTRWIADWFEVHNLQHRFEESRFMDDDTPWFEAGDAFMRERGYECVARDTTFNNENDLTQDFVWEVWLPEESDCSDWVWASPWKDNVVVVLYVHTGCGYSPPLFVECDDDNCETVFPLRWVCGYGIMDGRGSFGDDSPSHEVCEAHGLRSDEWCQGYSSAPWYHMTEQLEGEGFELARTLATGWVFRNRETKESVFIGADYWP